MRRKILGTAFGVTFALLLYSAQAQSAPDPDPDPDGRGSLGGGGPGGTIIVTDSATNPQLLVVNSSIFDCLSEPQLHALKIIQIEYGRDVSAAAAPAYEKIIAEFRRTDHPPRSAIRSVGQRRAAFAAQVQRAAA